MSATRAIATGSPLDRVLAQLPGARRSGDGYVAKCPAHEDREPSLSVGEGDSGRVLLNCHAGCAVGDIVAALALRWSDLFAEPRILAPATSVRPTEHVRHFDYVDLDGVLRYRVRRIDRPWIPRDDAKHKEIRPVMPDGSVGLKGVDRIPYRLPEVVQAIAEERRVYFVEGEAKAEELLARGRCATTTGSATSWRSEFAALFRDAAVVILPDADKPGREHARKVELSLRGVAKRVDVVELPGISEGGDVVDWFSSGRSLEELERVVDAAVNTTDAATDAVATDAVATDAVATLVAEMNKEFAVVLLGDRVGVLRERPVEGGRTEVQFMSLAALREWRRNPRLFDGKRMRSAADMWIDSPHRRVYDGIDFAPLAETTVSYNLWRGFSVRPDPRASCDRFLTHVKENVCGRDEALYLWVIGWFAHLVQRPAEKPGTSLVLRGKMGVGKTIVGETVGSLIPAHYRLVSDSRFIVGRFNGHLADCVLLFADEAFWAGDRAAEGKLKDLITGEHHLIEYKGKEPVRVRNYVRLLVSGNESWLVPAGYEERRFAVLDVDDAHIQDHAYFGAIQEELDRGGRGALLHYLQTFDLSRVNLRTVPRTQALYEQKLASLRSEEQWWLDVLHRGELPGDIEGTGEASRVAVHDSYVEHARRIGTTRRSIETMLGMFLMKVAGVNDTRPYRKVGDKMERVRCYQFPSLETCRRRFAERIRHDVAWPTDGQDWAPTTAEKWGVAR